MHGKEKSIILLFETILSYTYLFTWISGIAFPGVPGPLKAHIKLTSHFKLFQTKQEAQKTIKVLKSIKGNENPIICRTNFD